MEDDEISALTGFSKVPRHLQGSGGNVIIEGMSNMRPRSQSQEGFNTVPSQMQHPPNLALDPDQKLRLFQTMRALYGQTNNSDSDESDFLGDQHIGEDEAEESIAGQMHGMEIGDPLEMLAHAAALTQAEENGKALAHADTEDPGDKQDSQPSPTEGRDMENSRRDATAIQRSDSSSRRDVDQSNAPEYRIPLYKLVEESEEPDGYKCITAFFAPPSPTPGQMRKLTRAELVHGESIKSNGKKSRTGTAWYFKCGGCGKSWIKAVRVPETKPENLGNDDVTNEEWERYRGMIVVQTRGVHVNCARKDVQLNGKPFEFIDRKKFNTSRK